MERLSIANRVLRLGASVFLLVATLTAQTPQPLVIAKQGYFFVGGKYFDAPDGRFMSGHMYVEFQIPAKVTHRYPVVMFSGGGQSGLNYTGTPDGREGWMQYFLRQGYAVYVTRPAFASAIAPSTGSGSAVTKHDRSDSGKVYRPRACDAVAASEASHAMAGIWYRR